MSSKLERIAPPSCVSLALQASGSVEKFMVCDLRVGYYLYCDSGHISATRRKVSCETIALAFGRIILYAYCHR